VTRDDSVERIVDDTVGLALEGALVPRRRM
jgi:hypothetical protein